MDESRPLWSIENDELEQTAGAVGSEDKPAIRVITDLLDEQSVLHSVLHVLVLDPVAVRRSEDVHPAYRTTKSAKVRPLHNLVGGTVRRHPPLAPASGGCTPS